MRKAKPRPRVNNKPVTACKNLDLTRLVWEKVTVAPEVRRRKVFSRGRPKAEREVRPLGGHREPISTAGEEAECR